MKLEDCLPQWRQGLFVLRLKHWGGKRRLEYDPFRQRALGFTELGHPVKMSLSPTEVASNRWELVDKELFK